MHIYILNVSVHLSRGEMAVARKPQIDWKAVGRRVRELRGFDIHQAEFAHELSVSQGQLSRYEQGRSEIGAEVLLRLASKSGRTIEWLLTGKDRA
jgi:transcriptional regulator with XRE-family HTH domain